MHAAARRCNLGRQEIARDVGRDAQSISGIRRAIDCARCGEVDGRFTQMENRSGAV
jgi:hypothetical protein